MEKQEFLDSLLCQILGRGKFLTTVCLGCKHATAPTKARGPAPSFTLLAFTISAYLGEWLPGIAHLEKYSSIDMNHLGQAKNDSHLTDLI